MPDLIKRALISVSDKSGLAELGRFLSDRRIEILSTGGSAKALRDAGVDIIEVSDHTGFPEIMDGRVKTLQPAIHGGLLAVRGNAEHEAAMALKGTAGDIATSELATEISQAEGAASEAQRLAEDYIMVNVDGVDVPVDRDWYIEEHLVGPGAGSNTGSDVNLVEMVDNAGNSFFVDVGGVDELGNPYLTSSAATNPLITGDILTPAWAE